MVACILCAVQDLVKTYRVTEEDKKDADKDGDEVKMKGEIHSVPPSPIQLPPPSVIAVMQRPPIYLD